MARTEPSLLFTPIKIGNVVLKHRVVMAPLTRYRAKKATRVPHDFVKTYYSQRASTPGTLIISEGTLIAPQAGGLDSAPGIWSEEQIEAWRAITKEVHRQGSSIFMQLWSLGRGANPDMAAAEGIEYVSSSASPLADVVPRELTLAEIEEYIQLYAQAAENAVFKAGFDGVEIHAANGYLVDQFIQDVVNHRTDKYGGSIENRSRFALDIVQAVVERVGAERVAIRFSPWSAFQGMRMSDPIPQFTHLISTLASRYPTMAYLHLVDSRVHGGSDVTSKANESLDFARDAWRVTGQPLLIAGGFNRENALSLMAQDGMENVALVFGRHFIANPDLPKRLEKNIPLNAYDRSTFYKAESTDGYIDYPFSS